MAESVINGTDLYCFIDGVSIAHATSHTLSIKTAVIPKSDKDTGLYDTKLIGRSDVTVTCEGFVAYGDFEVVVNAKIARLPVTLSLGKKLTGVLDSLNPYFTGEFIITSYEMTATDNAITTYSVTFDHYSDFEFITNALPVILSDSNTVGLYDYKVDVTKDGSNRVSVWADRLGSGRNLLQSGADALKPVYSVDGILFDGSDDNLKASFVLIQPTFIYAVIKQVTWTNADRIWDGFTNNGGAFYQNGVSPTTVVYANSNALSSAQMTVDTWFVIRLLINGASSKLIYNDNVPLTGDPGAATMNGFTLGSDANGAFFGNIQVKEIIIRKIADTAGNELIIYNYLKSKYGL